MTKQNATEDTTEEETSILFRAEIASGWEGFRLTVFMGTAVFSLSYLLSGRVNSPLELFAWVFCLVFSSYLIADATYNVIRLWGKDLGGFLADADGVLDRSSWSAFGRVFWPEIRAIYPIPSSFLGTSKASPLIGLDVMDSYVKRRPAWIRFRIWLNRRVFRTPDLQFSSKNLRNSPERILRELQDRLEDYELRSISMGKELERGRDGGETMSKTGSDCPLGCRTGIGSHI
ncbi:MAG: hypothetical protein HKO65_01880 [Gemmatimonadetes bacterium]|nr:hypothetical protein [Gemmatimonadota bacterium]NNM03825.1 hypothetical protein [Gemmatimonadota bacterium]